MSTDLDLLMRLWGVGCRRYKVVSDRRMYHFARRSTGRVRKNRGSIFAMKWAIRESEFKDAYSSGSTKSTWHLVSRTLQGSGSLLSDHPIKIVQGREPSVGTYLTNCIGEEGRSQAIDLVQHKLRQFERGKVRRVASLHDGSTVAGAGIGDLVSRVQQHPRRLREESSCHSNEYP